MEIEDIERVAVIGAGIMGHGIACVCAEAGYYVNLMDVKDEALRGAIDRIKSELRILTENGVITKEKADATLPRIKGTLSLAEAVKDADFVIEAVPERMNLKRQVFKKLDELCSKHTIIATNTSTFMVTDIAAVVRRKNRVVGTHWWNPPYIIPLVEIVVGSKTSDETVNLTKEFIEKLGKTPIVCKESPGFIGSRIQGAMFREAVAILEEGVASVEDIDTTVKLSFGLRLPIIGPFEMADLGGLDTWLWAGEYYYKKRKKPWNKPPNLLTQKVKSGELGTKTGRGFYDYTGRDVNSILRERDIRLIKLLNALI